MKAGTIVGAVHSLSSIRSAQRLKAGTVDFLELRVDHFATAITPLFDAAPLFRSPLIITVRHPAEGGKHRLGVVRRRELYTQFLQWAAVIDVELRSMAALSGVVQAARAQGVSVIVSFHDFHATPSAARLHDIVRRAADAGADVIKIATRADTCAELHRLLKLLTVKTPRPLSVMAMGRFGKVSRLLFAQAGSVLNYGYLGTANASGQWSVREFRQHLAELTS